MISAREATETRRADISIIVASLRRCVGGAALTQAEKAAADELLVALGRMIAADDHLVMSINRVVEDVRASRQ